jgi:hypothetical protein
LVELQDVGEGVAAACAIEVGNDYAALKVNVRLFKVSDLLFPKAYSKSHESEGKPLPLESQHR